MTAAAMVAVFLIMKFSPRSSRTAFDSGKLMVGTGT
jgi:hypothetical protein